MALFEQLLAHHIQYQLPQRANELAIVHRFTGEIVSVLDQAFFKRVDAAEPSAPDEPVVFQWTDAAQPSAPPSYSPPAKQQTTPDRQQSSRSLSVSPSSKQPDRAKSPLRQTMDSIVTGSETIGQGLVTGAAMLGNQIHKGKDYLIGKVKPNQQSMVISPAIKQNVAKLRAGGKSMGFVTRHLANMVAYTAEQAGKIISKMLASQDKEGEYSDLRYALAQAVIATGHFLDGFEQGIKILAAEGGQATIELVTHKYGDEAGDVTAQVIGAANDMVLVYFDARGVSRKVFVKVAAKTAVQEAKTGI